MKKLLILAFQIFIVAFSYAQEASFEWAKNIGGSSAEIGKAVVVDDAGGVYTMGNFQGIIDCDPGPATYTLISSGNDDVFISKLDATGAFLWAKNIGGSSQENGYAITIDLFKNVYVTGNFGTTVDFDPGVGVVNLTSIGSADMFVLKLDVNGNFVWAKSVGSTAFDYGASIAYDGLNGICILGRFQGSADFDPGVGTNVKNVTGPADMFVLKLDVGGNFVWVKTTEGGLPTPNSITMDNNGNILVTGEYNFTVDFDPGVGIVNLISSGGDDCFILKLDINGNYVFVKTIGNTGNETSNGISIDALGNIYTSGTFPQTVTDFDPGIGVFNMTCTGNVNAYILKLDNNGNFVWAKNIGGTSLGDEVVNSMALDPSGNVYAIGGFVGISDFDPGVGVSNFVSNVTSSDIFILKLDSNGDFVWAKAAGSPSVDRGYSIAVDAAYNIYSVGDFGQAIDFDMGLGVFPINTLGGQDCFIQKMATCTLPTAANNLSLNTNLNICSGNASNLSASGSNVLGWYSALTGGTYLGGGSFFVTPALNNTTSYYVQDSSFCGLSISRTQITVTVNPLPIISVNSGSVCSGQSFTISPNGASTYTYSSGTNVVTPLANANYSVTGSDINGCASALAAVSNVTVNPLPILTVTSSNTLVCVGQTATITASGASTYTWNTGSTNPNVIVTPTVTANYNYTIMGTNAIGCQNTTVFTQSVSACTGINNLTTIGNDLFMVYPNPSKEKINIAIESANDYHTQIQILNALGQVVISEPAINSISTISISSLSSGIYFVKVIQQGRQQVLKLIKE